ncbi:hypothetical protein [Rhodococcus sp. NPDC057529]|uniref:hypothetical protein n=1 Tax=Rhodococcus sp. NPDC057529 TaxID=3346158 RepID=UPI00366D679C
MSILTPQRRITVGDRTQGPGRRVSDLIAESGITLPAAMVPTPAITGIVVAGLLAPQPDGATRTALQWSTITPIGAADVVHADTVVTRVQASGDGAVVDRRVSLVDEAGRVREEGDETWSVPSPLTAEADARTDFCTPEWGQLLRESLTADPTFASSLSTWDGTIGLCCVDGSGRSREVHVRIYRGRIIDVTRRVPAGATFTLRIPAPTWVDLVFDDRNDFMRRAISGGFSSSGDGYEYIRLTKPLNTIIAHARAIAGRKDRP